MTDIDVGGAPAEAPPFEFSGYLAREAARNRKADELRPANKAALFDALSVGGVTSVVVTFDGYGDSGQIESIDARDDKGEIALPEVDIDLAGSNADGSDAEHRRLPVRDAIEQLAYDLLSETHGGWENNDGAYGEFVFDVLARTIGLEHNSRYIAIDSYSHEW